MRSCTYLSICWSITFLLLSCKGYTQTHIMDSIAAQMNHQDYGGALRVINTEINAGRASNLLVLQKAICELDLGQPDSSVSTVNRIMPDISESDSLYERFLLIRSLGYDAITDIESAIADNEALCHLRPEKLEYEVGLARLYDENGQPARCINLLLEVYARDTNNIPAILSLSYFYGERENFEVAARFAAHGQKLAKDSTIISAFLNNLGYAQAMSVSEAEGLASIQRSLAYYPSNAFAYYNLGRIALRNHNRDTACMNFRRAKELGAVHLSAALFKANCE